MQKNLGLSRAQPLIDHRVHSLEQRGLIVSFSRCQVRRLLESHQILDQLSE